MNQEPKSREVHNYEKSNGDIRVTGFPFPPCDMIADIYRPRLCGYRASGESPLHNLSLNSRRVAPGLDHIDIIKMWRGLSSDKAEELLFWEATFREALADLVRGEVGFLSRYSDSHCLPDLSGQRRGNGAKLRYFSVDIVDLTTAMVKKAKRQGLPSFRWLASSGTIFNSVAQFIQIHDCFTYTGPGIEGLSIGIVLRQTSGLNCQTLVEGQWNPDFLGFDQWEFSLVEGDEFCLRPYYNSPSRGWDSSSALGDYNSLHFTSSASWLKWDSQEYAFTGTVPFFSGMQKSQQCPGVIAPAPWNAESHPFALGIIVTATMAEYFPGGARYEQAVRVRVTVNVARRPSQHDNEPESDKGNFRHPVETKGNQRSAGYKNVPDSKWSRSIYRDEYLGLGNASAPAPPNSRFASDSSENNNYDLLKAHLASSRGSSDYGSPPPPFDERLRVLPLRHCTQLHQACQGPSGPSESEHLNELRRSPSKPDITEPFPCLSEYQNNTSPIVEKLKGLAEHQPPPYRFRLDSGYVSVNAESKALKNDEHSIFETGERGFRCNIHAGSSCGSIYTESKSIKDEENSVHGPRKKLFSGESTTKIRGLECLGRLSSPSPPLGDVLAPTSIDVGPFMPPSYCVPQYPKHEGIIKGNFFFNSNDGSRESSPEQHRYKWSPPLDDDIEQRLQMLCSSASSPTQRDGKAPLAPQEEENFEIYSQTLRDRFGKGTTKMPEWTGSDYEAVLEFTPNDSYSSFEGGMTPVDIDDEVDGSGESSGTIVKCADSGMPLARTGEAPVMCV